MMQNQWASALDPVLVNPLVQGRLVQGVVLTAGDNVINHKLGRALVGWIVVRNTAATTFYDKQDSNTMSGLTLVLNASGACTVSLWVF
jgi:hypothetical protein